MNRVYAKIYVTVQMAWLPNRLQHVILLLMVDPISDQLQVELERALVGVVLVEGQGSGKRLALLHLKRIRQVERGLLPMRRRRLRARGKHDLLRRAGQEINIKVAYGRSGQRAAVDAKAITYRRCRREDCRASH